MIFVANHKTPEVLKPGKQSFDFPPASIGSEFSAILGFGFFTPFAMRRNHFNVSLIKQSLVKSITVIGLIANDLIRSILSKATVDGGFNKFYLMGRSAFNVSGDRKTKSVCDCHDLGTFATLCLADSKTPFFAGTKVPSMNASRISIWPRSYRSCASSWTMRWKPPCSTHLWNHRWQVWYGGYRWGKSFQGAPVRKIHKIPLKTCLRSLVGLPRGSFGGVNSLIIGSILFHCSFVMSILIILHSQDIMSRFICYFFKSLQYTGFMLNFNWLYA